MSLTDDIEAVEVPQISAILNEQDCDELRDLVDPNIDDGNFGIDQYVTCYWEKIVSILIIVSLSLVMHIIANTGRLIKHARVGNSWSHSIQNTWIEWNARKWCMDKRDQ